VLLEVMASAACYFLLRAVKRERAVARLQADFVASVSHEFDRYRFSGVAYSPEGTGMVA
jgi:hypothetical protein